MLRDAKVPKPKAVVSVSPWRHRDPHRIDAELMMRDLRQGGFETLAVRLDADHQHQAAIRQDPRSAAFEARHDRRATADEFGRAMRGLLGKRSKADADQPAVRLALLLAARESPTGPAVRRRADTLRVVAIVVAHAADRRERHLLRAHHVQLADLDRVARRGLARPRRSCVRLQSRRPAGRLRDRGRAAPCWSRPSQWRGSGNSAMR